MVAVTMGRGPVVRPKKASFDGGAADLSQQPARIKAGLFPSYAQGRMRPAGTGLHPRPERLVPREMGYFSSFSLCKSCCGGAVPSSWLGDVFLFLVELFLFPFPLHPGLSCWV